MKRLYTATAAWTASLMSYSHDAPAHHQAEEGTETRALRPKLEVSQYVFHTYVPTTQYADVLVCHHAAVHLWHLRTRFIDHVCPSSGRPSSLSSASPTRSSTLTHQWRWHAPDSSTSFTPGWLLSLLSHASKAHATRYVHTYTCMYCMAYVSMCVCAVCTVSCMYVCVYVGRFVGRTG